MFGHLLRVLDIFGTLELCPELFDLATDAFLEMLPIPGPGLGRDNHGSDAIRMIQR